MQVSLADQGRLVGERYQLLRELGRGGMGVVYLGRDLRRDMDVAIKFRTLAERDAALWLKREFRSVASLRHAHLVELYELVAHDDSCYFTMEYVPGVDPRRWCSDAPAAPVDFTRVAAVLLQLAEALAFLHARGVIHRDVKPSNTIVDNGTVKLLDFGLALERHRATDDLARETRIVGTAAYLAPEYLERLEVTPAIDVYALGVLAFELATGAPPFGGTLHVLARLARALSIPRAASVNPETPPHLDQLIAETLAADPAARPTAAEIAARLTGDSSRPRTARRAPGFVGRGAELARLAGRLVDPEPRGRLVVVSGPSGGGKTALVDAACAATRTPVWRGRCHDRERVPYRAFDAIVDDLATKLSTDAARAASLDHVAALARVFPAIAAVLEPGALTAPPAGDLRVERERAQLALVQLFRELAPDEGTLAVVIDDLQWADDASLELLVLLVERVARPLVVIASWTSGDADDGLRALLARLGTATAEKIDVPDLGEADVAALLAELAPRAPTTRLAAAARLAAGSPYLAQLIGRDLADLAETDVDDAAGAEARRRGRQAPAERAVAEIAALADGSTTFDELRALTALPSVQLSSALRGLEDEHVVRATPSASGDPVYVFYHQRLRDAAHAAVAPDARRALHARFAAHLEASTPARTDALAYHWEHAGEPMRAARWALAAADAARAQLAWDVAAAGYARALALGAMPMFRAELADCLFLAGKLAEAAREFLVLAGDGDGGDRWRVRAAEAFIKLGEIDRGLAILDPVLARHGHPRAAGRAGSVLRAAGVAARWIVPGRLRPPAPDAVLASAHSVLAKFMSTPYPVESLEYVLRDARDASIRGDTAGASTGMAMIAAYVAAGSLGRFGDRAIASAERLAAVSGTPYPAMVTAGCAGIVAMLRGDWIGMRAQHQVGEKICRALGLERSWEASFLRSYWALGELYAGQPARAVAMLGELDHTSDDLISRALLGSYRGRALLVSGDVAGATAIEAEIRRAPAARHGLASIYRQILAIELALAGRDWDYAAALVRGLAVSARAQWLSAMPAVGAMVDVLEATAALGLAATTPRSALHARTVARRLHRRGRASFYAPTALRLWGQAERMLGHASEATALLERASLEASRRGGAVDQLATAALLGRIDARDLGPLADAVAWSTGGAISPI